MIDLPALAQDLLALVASAILGGLIGLERELKGRWAGLRTHIMVAVGSTVFILAGAQAAGYAPSEITRVIQGVATGVGFIGAGTIIKLTERVEIKGLTTASTIWASAAVGTAAGLKMYYLAVGAAVIFVVVLRGVRITEGAFGPKTAKGSHAQSEDRQNELSDTEKPD